MLPNRLELPEHDFISSEPTFNLQRFGRHLIDDALQIWVFWIMKGPQKLFDLKQFEVPSEWLRNNKLQIQAFVERNRMKLFFIFYFRNEFTFILSRVWISLWFDYVSFKNEQKENYFLQNFHFKSKSKITSLNVFYFQFTLSNVLLRHIDISDYVPNGIQNLFPESLLKCTLIDSCRCSIVEAFESLVTRFGSWFQAQRNIW